MSGSMKDVNADFNRGVNAIKGAVATVMLQSPSEPNQIALASLISKEQLTSVAQAMDATLSSLNQQNQHLNPGAPSSKPSQLPKPGSSS